MLLVDDQCYQHTRVDDTGEWVLAFVLFAADALTHGISRTTPSAHYHARHGCMLQKGGRACAVIYSCRLRLSLPLVATLMYDPI